MKREKLHVVVW